MKKSGSFIALTGGIACGKSTVAEFWWQWGASIFDADVEAHAILEPGGECVEAVVREFGSHLLLPNGGIDRHELGRIIFGDPKSRKRLNQVAHPIIDRKMLAWAKHIQQQGLIGVGNLPLFFEVDTRSQWDKVVCVTATEEKMMERLLARGHSPEEAQERIASQWPVSKKCEQSDFVIENNGSLADLEEASREVWNNLLEQGE